MGQHTVDGGVWDEIRGKVSQLSANWCGGPKSPFSHELILYKP